MNDLTLTLTADKRLDLIHRLNLTAEDIRSLPLNQKKALVEDFIAVRTSPVEVITNDGVVIQGICDTFLQGNNNDKQVSLGEVRVFIQDKNSVITKQYPINSVYRISWDNYVFEKGDSVNNRHCVYQMGEEYYFIVNRILREVGPYGHKEQVYFYKAFNLSFARKTNNEKRQCFLSNISFNDLATNFKKVDNPNLLKEFMFTRRQSKKNLIIDLI